MVEKHQRLENLVHVIHECTLRQPTQTGLQHENCVRFWSPGGTESSVSRDLLKMFGFCKMFWIAKNVCDTVN